MVKNNKTKKKQTKKRSGVSEPTDKEIKQLESELKKLEKKDSSYGSPQPPPTRLNTATSLLFGASDWCIVLDGRGKAFGVWQDKLKDIRMRGL